MQGPRFEFGLDKPTEKDIWGTSRGHFHTDWILDEMKIYWQEKIETIT